MTLGYCLLAVFIIVAIVETASPSEVDIPDGWTLSHIGAAHCGRYALDSPDGLERKGIVWCEWPGANDRVRLSARCRNQADGEVVGEGAHDEAVALSRSGRIESGSRFPFDTERSLLGDYVSHCEGRPTRSDALPILDNDPTVAWVEHLSSRPGGCRWLNIVPTNSDFVGPDGNQRIVYNARRDRGRPRDGVPVLLAECCTGEPDGPPVSPLSAFIDIDSFPDDPSAAFVTAPWDWILAAFRSTGDELFYDRAIEIVWSADDHTIEKESVRMTRRSVTWSTRTSYQAIVDGRTLAEVFGDGGNITMTLATADGNVGVHGVAEFGTGDRTRKFMAACAATVGE